MSDLSDSDARDRFAPSSARGGRALPLPSLTATATDPLLMRIIAYYGPTAFGLVCFLAVWFSAVRPTLESNRVDSSANQAIVHAMQDTVRTLSAVVDRLERLERRMTGP